MAMVLRCVCRMATSGRNNRGAPAQLVCVKGVYYVAEEYCYISRTEDQSEAMEALARCRRQLWLNRFQQCFASTIPGPC